MSLSKAKEVVQEVDSEIKAFKTPVNALTLQKALEKALRPVLSALQEIHEALFQEEGELSEEDIEAEIPKVQRKKADGER